MEKSKWRRYSEVSKEELKYSEKRMIEYFGEQQYQDILEKVKEINK